MRAFLAPLPAQSRAPCSACCDLVVVVVLALLAPLISSGSPFAIVGKPFPPPFGEFLFGTDSLGRDLAAGIVHGARTSLLIGIVATLAAVLVGTLIGGARRLLRRLRRRRADARHRVLPDHPVLHVRHRAGRDPAPSVASVVIAIAIVSLAADRAPGARRVPHDARPRVRAGLRSSLGMTRHCAIIFAPDPAQRAVADHRHRLAAGRHRDPDRIGAVVPRPGRAQPHELGLHDRRRPRRPARCLVAVHDPGRRDPAHRAGDQPRRRRSQRRAQSAAARRYERRRSPRRSTNLTRRPCRRGPTGRTPSTDVTLALDAQRDPVRRRRIRLGQVGDGRARSCGLLPAPHVRVSAGQHHATRARTCCRLPPARMRAVARQPHRDDLPGADDGAQSGDDHRPADRRDHRGASPRCAAAAAPQRIVEMLADGAACPIRSALSTPTRTSSPAASASA